MTDTMTETQLHLLVERCNDSGELMGIVQLDSEYFGALVNVPLLHQVVTAQLAAKRSGTHSTKTRAEVAGGGAKPYRQKGTGRARQGTTRAPQFAGGGVAFGPKPRDYSQSTPRKMVRQALRAALSDRALEGRICLVDRWSYEIPKTKAALASLRALGLDGHVLVVLGGEDVVAERCFGNLPDVDLVEAGQLTAYDVVRSDWVVFTDETVPGLVSDAPEGSVAFSSARPEVTEPDEDQDVPVEDLDEVAIEQDTNEGDAVEIDPGEDEKAAAGTSSAGPAGESVEAAVSDESDDEEGSDVSDDEEGEQDK